MSFLNPILASIRADDAPKGLKMIAANGALPVPADQLLQMQCLLAQDKDEDIRAAAHMGLNSYSEDEIGQLLESTSVPGDVLDFCAVFFLEHEPIIEKLLLNVSTLDTTFCFLASRVPASLLDLFITNVKRIIEYPMILTELRRNPNLSPGNLSRLDEIQREFIPLHRPTPTVTDEAHRKIATTIEENSELYAKLGDSHFVDPATELSPEEEAWINSEAGDDPEELSTLVKIGRLPISGKVHLAMIGKREERALLIRDSNRIVALAVLASPKINESEIEMYSQLRNVSEDVLRTIASNREWVKNYRIAFHLVKNPRTPVNLALPLISRLSNLDLRILQKDRGVTDAIRAQAKRIIATRTV